MSLIRVGLSTSLVEPVLNGGHLDGIGVYTSALMQYLPEEACEVNGYSFPPLRRAALAREFSVGKPMPHSAIVSSAVDVITPSFVKRRMDMDLFHVTDYRIIRMSCPVVATLHDAIPQMYPEWTRPELRRLKNWGQRLAARKADHVIALSKYSVTELVQYFGIDERRITVVPCGVSSAWLEPASPHDVQQAMQEHGLQPGYFLFVGTLQPRKNVERIIDAYLALPAAIRKERQLVIVGRPGWRCDDVLHRIKAAQQQGEQVVWLNYIAGESALRQLYAGAGIFVFPSLHEGFGIPVVEAFASRVPVVTANTTSLPEVSMGAALEVDPLSVGEIGQAMQRLASDEALRQQCIAAGRKRAEELTWQNTVKQTVEVYRQVLAG